MGGNLECGDSFNFLFYSELGEIRPPDLPHLTNCGNRLPFPICTCGTIRPHSSWYPYDPFAMSAAKQIAVFGSTGSIGTQTLDVIAGASGRLEVAALSAHSRLDLLAEQARQHRPRLIIATDKAAAKRVKKWDLPSETELLIGSEALETVARDAEIDLIVAAIVGSAGLASTWAALEAGKTVALANKETLVTAGPLVRKLLEQSNGQLLPVDSEHSAVMQALADRSVDEVDRVVLTASGGPFRDWTADALKQVTVDDALAHPTWDMGKKNYGRLGHDDE